MDIVKKLRWHGTYIGEKRGAWLSRQKEEREAAANEIERLRIGIAVCHASLLDSVDTHGTHGGWLHGEANALAALLTPNALAQGPGGSSPGPAGATG